MDKSPKIKHITNNPGLKREGLSFKKSSLLLLIIILQLVLFLVTYLNFVHAFTWIYAVSIVISFLTSLRVMIYTKNSAAKSSWILFLMLFPTFGFIIYYLAGGSHIHPRHKKRLEAIDAYADEKLGKTFVQGLSSELEENLTYLNSVTNAQGYNSRGAKYYPDGETAFSDIIESLKAAQTSIYLEFFIISRGDLFAEILEILLEKAAAGVKVRIIYDGFGSKDLMSRALRKTLKNSSIEMKAFVPIKPIFSFFLNYRDHRKVVIVDGEVGYLGGFNLADEYVNKIERFGYWKDSGLKLTGQSVDYLTLSFLKMWMFITKKPVDLSPLMKEGITHLESKAGLVVPYVTGPYQPGSVARSFYLNVINNARSQINIMSPYFIVDEGILETLRTKVASGVEVNLIIPGVPDKKMVYSLSKAMAYSLTLAGCHVYLYEPGFIHAKNVLVDGQVAIVGSINFDYRSFYQQYESGAYLCDEIVAQSLQDDFIETMQVSKLVEPPKIKRLPFFYRLYIGILKWVSPLM